MLSRRVGGDEVEVTRTSQRGVYAGAMQAYLGDRVPQVYNNSLRVTEPTRFFVLPADTFAEIMQEWFPMAVHLLEGLFFGVKSTQQAVGQRERLLALGSLSAGLTHELNNPAAAAVRAHGLAARTGGQDAPQAADHLRGHLRPADAGGPDRDPGAHRRAGRQGTGAQPAGGGRPGGHALRLAGRPRHRRRLADRPDVRAGRTGRGLAGAGGRGRGRGAAAQCGGLAELHRRDRAADGRDPGLRGPHLAPRGRRQAVLAARPRPLPGRRRARTPRQHAADAVGENGEGHPRGQGLRPDPAPGPGLPLRSSTRCGPTSSTTRSRR